MSPPPRRSSAAPAAGLPCEQCQALCCRYLATEIDAPHSRRDVDDIRWYLLHRDVSVFIDRAGSWFLAFASPCRELSDEGRCRRYAERPRLCREHGRKPGSCEYYGPLQAVRFTSVEEFDCWLRARRGELSAPGPGGV